jgi:hypothetical protein
MDHRLLPHFGELDGSAALARFCENYDGSHGDAGEALTDMSKALVHLSVDLSKHGLREMALALMNSGIETGGWVFESVALKSRLDLAFTMAKDGAGYLVRVKLYPDMTEEAAGKMEVFRRQRVENLSTLKAEDGLEGADYEKAKWKILFTDRIPEEDAVKRDPASYKPADDCLHVEEVLCVAFSTKGKLRELVEGDLEGYLPSKVFEIRPEMSFDRGWAKNPSLPPMADVRDFEAALHSLRIAGEGLRAAGLMSKVSDFASSRRDTQYTFIGDDQSAPVMEFAAASVAPEGIVTERTVGAVSALWRATATIDANEARADILSVIGLLSANGHASSSTGYECNDADDFSWLEEAGEGQASIWLRGQNGNYQIDTAISDAGLDILRLSGVSSRMYRDGSASDSQDARFICEFRASGDNLEPFAFEEMTMRRIRDVNNILFTLRSVACCLDADYKSAADIAPA